MSVAGVEWTGAQQVSLFLQSAGLGLLLGVLFDMLGGVQPLLSRRRVIRWTLDILYGTVAAMITFFTALGKMDGVMHPLLFGGILLGMAVEHAGVGHLVQRLTLYGCRLTARTVRWLTVVGRAAAVFLRGLLPRKNLLERWRAKKPPKQQKKSMFFSKRA